MLNLKKFFLISVSLGALVPISFASNSVDDGSGIPDSVLPQEVASDLKIELNAYMHFQAGYLNQNKLVDREKNVSRNKEHIAFYNESAFAANISADSEDLTYGGKIVLVPTTKKKGGSDFNGSHIYLQNGYGKLQLGCPVPPSSVMMIKGSTISIGTFDNWNRYADTRTAYLSQGFRMSPSFATAINYYTDSKLLASVAGKSYSTEPARSIAYYTPKFKLGNTGKLQLGVSYSPDSSNTGVDNPNVSGTKASTYIINNNGSGGVDYTIRIFPSVKDIMTAGIVLEQKFTDEVKLKVAATGEYGKSTSKVIKFSGGNKDNNLKLSDLKTFNIGTILEIGNISCASGYGTLGKSLTTPEVHKTGRKTDYYSGAIAYKEGPFAASISYFKSIQYKNTVDAISLGTHYQLAPGFKPYAEISTFTLKGKPEAYPEFKKRKSKGIVLLLGTKLSL